MITVKNVKVMESLSDETLCYSATIYYNNTRCGTARNHGQGGETMIDPIPGKEQIFKHAIAWALAQPPEEVEYLDTTLTIESTLEGIVDDLAEKFDEDRKLRSKERANVLYQLDNNLSTWYMAGYEGVRRLNDTQRVRITNKLRNQYGDRITAMRGHKPYVPNSGK